MEQNNKIELRGLLRRLPGYARGAVFAFLIAMSFGYASGFKFLLGTAGTTPKSVEQQYLGNEDDEDAEEMKFKKSENELITLIHGHAVSFALIFLAVGGLMLMTSYPDTYKKILVTEPFISIVVTFGGIWLLWHGWHWMVYVIMISGTLLHLSFAAMVVLISMDILKK